MKKRFPVQRSGFRVEGSEPKKWFPVQGSGFKVGGLEFILKTK